MMVAFLCTATVLLTAGSVAPASRVRGVHAGRAPVRMSADHDILLRVARGQTAERTPVWMMRQAGRYMKAFRAISTKYPFRQRSETPGA